MSAAWKDYQEKAASTFRGLGFEASTDVTLKGVRTTHDIDVVVRSRHVGFEIMWLVECKLWKTAVSKLHVLALREIVADTGADRGILLAEAGFQIGAIEAATLTNVQVTSLLAVSESSRQDVFAMRIRDLYENCENVSDRYWALSKEDRIKYQLRPEVGSIGYSGLGAISVCRDVLSRAMRGMYPFKCEDLHVLMFAGIPEYFIDAENVVSVVEKMLDELDGKLSLCEAASREH